MVLPLLFIAGLSFCPRLIPVSVRTNQASPAEIDGARLVEYARAVVIAQVAGRRPPREPDLGPATGVFVTIERNGQILGCRGSLQPLHSTLAQEIAEASRSAAAHDPRYRPLSDRDLKGFLVTVTKVNRMIDISTVEDLIPSSGLVLTAQGKSGIVLPWEGKDPHIRLQWAYKKAGVPVGSACRLQAMDADRWRG